ncbi:MAG: glycosyltransferase family 1 protein [Nitrolancea sp.]
MKIGVMLRHLGQPGGIGVYTSNIVESLLQVDRSNEYFFLYQHEDQLQHFPDYPNATEVVLHSKSKLGWDQITVPLFARRNGIDLLYNPKLSVPLITQSKTVLVMHGAEQFAVPHAFKWHDRIYFSIANRLYVRRADSIIAMTNMGAKDISRYMHADPRKISVIPESYNERCRVLERQQLLAVKEKYSLPDQFILFVGGLNPIKNFRNLLRAYRLVRNQSLHKLVVVGFKRWGVSDDLQLITQLGLDNDVVFPGYLPDEDIPAMYGLADAFVFPSLYEGFGMPVLEAMACACPVITTKRGCSPEVAGDAAILVDPEDPNEIAMAVQRVLNDDALSMQLVERGLERVRQFSWEKCARETLAVLEAVGSRARTNPTTVVTSTPFQR